MVYIMKTHEYFFCPKCILFKIIINLNHIELITNYYKLHEHNLSLCGTTEIPINLVAAVTSSFFLFKMNH